MNPAVLLIVGEPGSGKSSLVEALTGPLAYSVEKKPFWHTIYYDSQNATVGSQFGWTPEFGEGKKFPGTDRLAFDIVPKAVGFLKVREFDAVIVEGDRLSHSRFIVGAMAAGYSVEIVRIHIPEDVAAARRSGRSNQDEAWIRSRQSHVESIVKEFEPWVVAEISGTLDHMEQLRQLNEQSEVGRKFVAAWPTEAPES